MTTRRWSIARRSSLWFAFATTALVAALAAASGWFLTQSVGRELEGLVAEELDELEVLLSVREATAQVIRDATVEFAENHPGVDIAWRIWAPGSDEPWGEFGQAELLAEFGAQLEPHAGASSVPGPGLRWRVREIGDLRVGLLLNGSSRLEVLRHFGVVALVSVLVAALVALMLGAAFGSGVGRMLRSVARRAREAYDAGDLERLHDEDLPDEIRDVAAALRETLRSIQSDSERARLLVAGMAHELRSPIQNMLGEAQVLLLRERAPEEYQEALLSQLDELRDLGSVVDNLVTLCASTDVRSGNEVFDLGAELDMRLEKERHYAARRDVAVVVSCEGSLEIAGDREAVLLAVRNLVANAVDFSPPGGTVEVHVHGDEAAVRILVDDQGAGVPESEREAIFEPFHQGKRQNGRRAGYGIGLALVRSAVESHNGQVKVENAPGGGARFRVDLPRACNEMTDV